MDIKTIFRSLITIIIVGVFAYIAWTLAMYRADRLQPVPEGVACTADAMQCPDGTWVGRSGPGCTFSCPVSSGEGGVQNAATVQTRLGETVRVGNITLTPLGILEDSRCPQNVQCIQAGTVRLSVRIVSGLGTAQEVFTLGGSVTTEAEAITLLDVAPLKNAGEVIEKSEYQFTFEVTPR